MKSVILVQITGGACEKYNTEKGSRHTMQMWRYAKTRRTGRAVDFNMSKVWQGVHARVLPPLCNK